MGKCSDAVKLCLSVPQNTEVFGLSSEHFHHNTRRLLAEITIS